jgi:uncharacterized DUF497 family protein
MPRFYIGAAPCAGLLIVHGAHEAGPVVRLISARKAARSERAQYDARWKR